MAGSNVDINLEATQGNNTKKNLKDILDKLKEINKLSTFELKSENIKKITDEIEKQSEQQIKVNKNLEQREMLFKRLEVAQRNNWREAEKEINNLIQLNKDEKEITSLMLKKLDTLTEKEKTRIKWAKEGKKVREDDLKLEEQINQAKDKQIAKNKEIQKSMSKSYSSTLSEQGAFLSAKETQAIEKGYNNVYNRVMALKEQVKSGNVLTENQLKFLGKIEEKEKLKLSILKEEVGIRNKLNKISETQTKKMLDDELEAYRINDKINAQHKESIALQKHKLDMMSEQVRGKNGYDKLNSKIAQFNNQLKNGKTLTNDQLRSLQLTKKQLDSNNKSLDKNVNSLNKIATAYILINGIRKGIGALKQDIQELRDLDQAVYNLGVVSKLSTSRIENLKYELLDMGSKFPVQANEIAKAMDTIGRTGITFEDNLQAIDDVIKLAISSGSQLSETAGIIAKTMVSFSLAGDRATEAVDAMHSVVLSSPLTLESLNSSLANSANAFATLIEFTDKSGTELEIYQEKLLRLDLAMTGGLAKIGKMYADLKFCELLENGVRQVNYNVTGNGERECLKIAC